MKIVSREIKKHLFICCNHRDNGKSCCADKEAKDLLWRLKKRLRDNDYWSEIKVTSSGCLGPCESGITATLYPQNLLLTDLSLASEDELYELLTKG